MRGAVHPLPNTPSWRCAQLKHRDNIAFTAAFLAEKENVDLLESRAGWETHVLFNDVSTTVEVTVSKTESEI
jgi:hypothetical protein